jgi:RNA-directed DNA polymerase
MTIASRETQSPTEDVRMMEIIVTRQNMLRAYRRVLANKGAPGVDGMTVGQLKSFLKRCWPKIKQALLDGTYRPLPVRRKETPKPNGGIRLLGIPTVVDRLIQQAIAQIL